MYRLTRLARTRATLCRAVEGSPLQSDFHFQQVAADGDIFKDCSGVIANLQDLAAVVTRAEVCGDEVPDPGFFRDAGSVFHRGVFAVACKFRLIGTERGFVDQRRAVFGEFDRAFGKLCIQTIHYGLSRTRSTQHHLRS